MIVNEPSSGIQASDDLRRLKHDMRNAANSASLALHVATNMLRMGNLEGAAGNIDRAREACDRMAQLLDAEGLADGSE